MGNRHPSEKYDHQIGSFCQGKTRTYLKPPPTSSCKCDIFQPSYPPYIHHLSWRPTMSNVWGINPYLPTRCRGRSNFWPLKWSFQGIQKRCDTDSMCKNHKLGTQSIYLVSSAYPIESMYGIFPCIWLIFYGKCR